MQHNEYDIGAAFQAIEDELIKSMIRNMDRHRAEETKEGIEWSMWQAEQLKALEKYKQENQKRYQRQFKDLNKEMGELIRIARQKGNMQQEIQILNAIRKGFPAKKISKGATAEFFRMNDRKLEALIKATTNDMQQAETAVLRMANDQYRKAIFNAQVYANSGAGTYEKAVDMATRDMLSRGLNCVEYANGARHTLADYADMAIRTASKRAYLQGEGEKRQEWGITTVIVNKRGNPCPKCLPFVGKILIDDVWSGGKKSDGPYPLMSKAIAAGLYHPRCKDSHTTYFLGISTADDTWTEKELEAVGQANKREARQQYASRQAERYGRLAKYSLDEDNKKQYGQRAKEWQDIQFKTGGMGRSVDVTEKWIKGATPNSHEIVDLSEYTSNGTTYKVDGKHVLLDYSDKEKQVAQLLERELGGEISMVPRVLDPPGISTPDYMFRGEAYDLKELSGTSKNLVYNVISKKKRQANNFVLDISQCPLDEDEIYKQIDGIYWSRHTTFVDKIILIKDDQIRKILIRKIKEKRWPNPISGGQVPFLFNRYLIYIIRYYTQDVKCQWHFICCDIATERSMNEVQKETSGN